LTALSAQQGNIVPSMNFIQLKVWYRQIGREYYVDSWKFYAT